MNAVQVLILLTIGYVAMTIDRKQKNFPLPVFLVAIGFGLSFLPFFTNISVSKDVIYDIYLPGLLFTSAYHYSARSLKKHAKIIGVLSTGGLLITAIILGFVSYWISSPLISISLVGALLVASILTPTDPVSVVSILEKSLDDPSVSEIVDGESMINDGTSVVLFTVLLTMYTEQRDFAFWSFIGKFFSVSIGGICTGLAAGWLISKAIHISERENQVLLSIVTAYGAFHLAEAFGFSGVLATVAAGIMLSAELESASREEEYRSSLNGFWEVAEPALLSVLFLVIGITASDYLIPYDNWLLASGIFVISVLIRFAVISGTMQIFSGYRKLLDFKKAALLSWAGIRGTMSIFLLLSLADKTDEQANMLVSLGFAVVFLSLVMQSIGIYPLSKLLKAK